MKEATAASVRRVTKGKTVTKVTWTVTLTLPFVQQCQFGAHFKTSGKLGPHQNCRTNERTMDERAIERTTNELTNLPLWQSRWLPLWLLKRRSPTADFLQTTAPMTITNHKFIVQTIAFQCSVFMLQFFLVFFLYLWCMPFPLFHARHPINVVFQAVVYSFWLWRYEAFLMPLLLFRQRRMFRRLSLQKRSHVHERGRRL